MFNTITFEQIVWRPYDDYLPRLPAYNTRGIHIWLACVPLFCYNVIEYHRPDRVLRLFGKIKHVFGPCVHDAFHLKIRTGKKNINWSDTLGLRLVKCDDQVDRLALGDDRPVICNFYIVYHVS